MSTTKQPGRPIPIGMEWRQQVVMNASPVLFPSGVTLVGQFRRRTTDETALATISTANGGIARVNDTTLDLYLPASATAGMLPGTVVVDFVRTDTSEPMWLPVRLTIPVIQPVTREFT